MGVDLTVPLAAGAWRSGDLAAFALDLRHSGSVEAPTVVAQPGTVSLR